ncbi:transcription factor S-II, central domain-containing protein [Amylocarpus encephaloides]|uniref:Transcription factor BYE1 n=1 Tax=Amylocarpus encephaloides TaxID=45428 RepID=A0A9P7YF91_9HELO|nr:transcription factor S-II, central domain-containing protein [Amylocarpus encephaloides]
MADEPRRSVRATKGQHTKSLDILDQPIESPKKKATKKAPKKAEAAEDVEIIRCVCGAVEQGDDEGEPWIACDECDVWQHNICVGVSRFEEDAPKNYLCEQHDPSFPPHKALLDGKKKGKKIWEERRMQAEAEIALEEAAKEAAKKKGGKKGKAGKRISDGSELSHATNGKGKSPSVPVTAPASVEKKTPVARSGSTKRKTRDESQEKDAIKAEPQTKVRKVSAAHTTSQQKSPPSDLPAKVLDIESSRQKFAKAIKDKLQPIVKTAVQNIVYSLTMGDTVESKSERLAIQVEDAINTAHPDKDSYSRQFRLVTMNLKLNQELVNSLLTRTLTPNTLATMSSDDMASKELKLKTAEIKAAADKQSIMIQEDNAPRVRRTHKGDEIVETDNDLPQESMPHTAARRRAMLDPNADLATRSRDNSPGSENDMVELPADIGNYQSRDAIRPTSTPKQPLVVDTNSSQPPMRKASTTKFNINKVFSSVQSPVNIQHHVRRQSSNVAPPVNGPGVDPEIDKLLQDDEGDQSPPYSPAEYDSDPEIVWRGNVAMDSVAKFPATAKHVAGADISLKQPWADVIAKELKVAGRIDREKANEYLCSLRYSLPTDVVVIAITPVQGASGSETSEALFDYFFSKKRFGVLANKGVANIRDTYLVPVSKSPARLPDFVINLEGHKVPEQRGENMLLVTLVIRPDVPTDPLRSADISNEAQSPSIQTPMSHSARAMSISGAPPAMSPINAQNAQFNTPPMPQNAQFVPPADGDMAAKQREGEEQARQILGPFFGAPTVAFLVPQAHQMRPLEWERIRNILENDDKAQIDLTHLSVVLAQRLHEHEAKGQA